MKAVEESSRTYNVPPSQVQDSPSTTTENLRINPIEVMASLVSAMDAIENLSDAVTDTAAGFGIAGFTGAADLLTDSLADPNDTAPHLSNAGEGMDTETDSDQFQNVSFTDADAPDDATSAGMDTDAALAPEGGNGDDDTGLQQGGDTVAVPAPENVAAIAPPPQPPQNAIQPRPLWTILNDVGTNHAYVSNARDIAFTYRLNNGRNERFNLDRVHFRWLADVAGGGRRFEVSVSSANLAGADKLMIPVGTLVIYDGVTNLTPDEFTPVAPAGTSFYVSRDEEVEVRVRPNAIVMIGGRPAVSWEPHIPPPLGEQEGEPEEDVSVTDADAQPNTDTDAPATKGDGETDLAAGAGNVSVPYYDQPLPVSIVDQPSLQDVTVPDEVDRDYRPTTADNTRSDAMDTVGTDVTAANDLSSGMSGEDTMMDFLNQPLNYAALIKSVTNLSSGAVPAGLLDAAANWMDRYLLGQDPQSFGAIFNPYMDRYSAIMSNPAFAAGFAAALMPTSQDAPQDETVVAGNQGLSDKQKEQLLRSGNPSDFQPLAYDSDKGDSSIA